MPKFCKIFARKINKIPDFYMIFAQKIFFPNFGGQVPPSPTPMGDSVPAFQVKLGASYLNCVDVPLKPTHSLTY